VTEIRIRAEQKGIVSVEIESNRLKCLRSSGRRDDFGDVGVEVSAVDQYERPFYG
jgi:transcription-repair coupling factor (superfamily II helicase)